MKFLKISSCVIATLIMSSLSAVAEITTSADVDLINACKSGDQAHVFIIINRNPRIEISPYCLSSACESGNLALVQQLKIINPQLDFNWNNIRSACRSGNLGLVQYLLEQSLAEALLRADARANAFSQKNKLSIEESKRVHLSERYHARKDKAIKLNIDCLCEACRSGNAELVQFIYKSLSTQHNTAEFDSSCLQAACESGNYALVLHILDSTPVLRFDRYSNCLQAAHQSGNQVLVNYIEYMLAHLSAVDTVGAEIREKFSKLSQLTGLRADVIKVMSEYAFDAFLLPISSRSHSDTEE